DLWERYSLYKKGRTYQVVVTENEENIIGRLFVDIISPRFEYVVLQLNESDKICYSSADTITVNYNDTIKLIDFKTNIPGNFNTKTYVSGPHSNVQLIMGEPVETRSIISSSIRGKAEYAITLKREDITIGSIQMKISENPLAFHRGNGHEGIN
ncbi:MAG: hypothetical protein JXB42_09255, partial [Deltaproteobacteria bacterium]|nr:hypothetical protein [Deltaproteobacteria bacterium]